MGQHDEGRYLSKIWACLTCYWKGPAGSMKFVESDPGLACPACGSVNINPADKGVITLPCYLGDRGTLH